ncbi:DUF799 domain-containing protein [Flavobacteriaceae bacterium]|jgi:hypothetical protein|nr:DUF799 domain-containing protein [Flavobacteriaceae bacterium]
MKNIVHIICLLLIINLTSCSSSKTLTKFSQFPDLYKESPKTILFIPPINNTTAADAKDLLRTTIAPVLSEKGYYVLPIEPIFDFFKLNGAYSIAETSDELPLDKFYELFEADAALMLTINGWDKKFYVVGGHVRVDLLYELISTKTGKTLWKVRKNLKVDTSSSNQNAGILTNILATAINTAATKYVDIAKQAHVLALSTIPSGFRSLNYLKDKEDKIKL